VHDKAVTRTAELILFSMLNPLSGQRARLAPRFASARPDASSYIGG
jgi:hypothetical protein